MNVLVLTLFVSGALAAFGVGLFVWTVMTGAHEHDERLAILPIEADSPATPPSNEPSTPPPRERS